MDIITPDIGLVFWTVSIFLILLVVLRAFAWKPIVNAVNQRNQQISEALNAADKAKEEMKKLQAQNEEILKKAHAERDQILKEARDLKDEVVAESKEKAIQEADKIIEAAKNTIENQKRAAIEEMKNQMATISVQIAEKLLRKELDNKEEQNKLIEGLLDDTNIN